MENNEVNKKSNGGIVLVLIAVIIGLIGYIVYDKFISKVPSSDANTTLVESTNKESNSLNENVNSLSGKTYYNDLDDEDYYLKFTSSTSYILIISKKQNEDGNVSPYTSKGTYTYDGENVTLSDNKINAIYKEGMFYINYGNYKMSAESLYYDIYMEKTDATKIKSAVENYILTNNDSAFTNKLSRIDTEVNWCYTTEPTENFGCSTETTYYFNDYDKAIKDADVTSVLEAGSTPEWDDEDKKCEKWSFYAIEKNNSNYNAISSYTGM